MLEHEISNKLLIFVDFLTFFKNTTFNFIWLECPVKTLHYYFWNAEKSMVLFSSDFLALNSKKNFNFIWLHFCENLVKTLNIASLRLITTQCLCSQSPLNLHQFCLTRFQISRRVVGTDRNAICSVASMILKVIFWPL